MTNMLYMAKNVSTKQLGGDVPEGLVDAFDELVERLGLTKKRAIAAAVHAFIEAEKAKQFKAYQDVYEKYYAEGASSGGGSGGTPKPPSRAGQLQNQAAKELSGIRDKSANKTEAGR